MGMHDDLLTQFHEALTDGQIPGHRELLLTFNEAPEDLLAALSEFSWEAGYDEASGVYGLGLTNVPTPDEIRQFRIEEGLDPKQAAKLIHYSEQTWALWESGKSEMPLHAWELLRLKRSDPDDTSLRSDAEPTPQVIRDRRKAARLTLASAARIVHCTVPAWQHWEGGKRKMKRSVWELFLIKVSAPNLI